MVDSETPLYVYKMIADNGGAPCVFGGLLSLAICKPKIRGSAEEGSILFGVGGKAYGERLIYIARVTSKVEDGDYYRKRVYSNRPDCIYRHKDGKPVRKVSAQYHADSDQRRRDVGPEFESAQVLLSDDFRYLGCKGTDDYKRRYPRLRKLIENLKQGHRKHHEGELRNELMALKDEVWRSYPRKKVGAPSDSDTSLQCNRDEPCRVC